MHFLFSQTCENCELLKELLESERFERRKLLEVVLELTHPTVGIPITQEEFSPIQPKIVPWRIKQQQLEQEDRAKAEQLKKNREKEINSIAELEKELSIGGDL